ncbi:MAG TPA: hypothetical protein VF520_14920 [Thermoleophilaceae bacterium]|jgi:hypothetical protein
MHDEPTAVPEVVDEDGRALPVLAAEVRAIERPPDATLAAPVAAATGGFLAGLFAFVLVRGLRRRPRGVALRGRGRARGLEVSASRSFLVDVHVLKR